MTGKYLKVYMNPATHDGSQMKLDQLRENQAAFNSRRLSGRLYRDSQILAHCLAHCLEPVCQDGRIPRC